MRFIMLTASASPHTQVLLVKGVLTLLAIAAALVANGLLKMAARNQLAQGKIKRPTAALLRRLTNGFLILLTLVVLSVVWGVDIENIWVSLTSVLALIAIGFIAIWSMLSNVVAGLLIVLSKPFRVEDRVRIMPEGFEGEVVEIASLFVVLKLADGGTMYIPNNQVLQKAIVNLGAAQEETQEQEQEDTGDA